MKETILMDPVEIVGTPPSTGMFETLGLVALIGVVVILAGWALHAYRRRQTAKTMEAFDRYQEAIREEEETPRKGGFTPPTRPARVLSATFRSEPSKSNASYSDPAYPPPTYDFAGYDSGGSYDSGSSDSGSSDCGSDGGGSCD